MRKESSRLWEQALYDLDTAETLITVKTYYASVFFSEQAAEKALKALHLERKRKIQFTHDLTELAADLNAPAEVAEAAAELSPDYIVTRYPDAANGVPAKMYNERSARLHLDFAKRVMNWVKKELKLET